MQARRHVRSWGAAEKFPLRLLWREADRGNHRVEVFGAQPTPSRRTTWDRVKALYQ